MKRICIEKVFRDYLVDYYTIFIDILILLYYTSYSTVFSTRLRKMKMLRHRTRFIYLKERRKLMNDSIMDRKFLNRKSGNGQHG